MWGTLADGRIYANASQRFAHATWFHQTPNPYNEERAQRTEMIPWGDIKRCNAIGISVNRVQADGFTLHRCLLTDQNALAKHCTCLGVGEAKLFQVSKRALLSSCWVFDWCGKLWQTAGSMPMRRKDWSTRHGFTKHTTHTTRTVRTKPRQSLWVISSDAMRLGSRYIKSRRMDSLCISACQPTITFWQSTVPVLALVRRHSSRLRSDRCYPAVGFLIGVGNSGRRPDLCQCVTNIGPRDMVSATTFQASKRALLSSCWVFDRCGKLWKLARSMPMRRKDSPKQLGFTKHPTLTTRTVLTKLR